MTNNYDFLKHTQFFSEVEEIISVDKISENKLKITSRLGKDYVFAYYDIKDHEAIESEQFIQGRLKDIGLTPLRIYEEGIMPDIDKSYKIFEYRQEISLGEFLRENSDGDCHKVGIAFGKVLKDFHQVKPTVNIDWEKKFLTKSNYLFYIHGLSEDIGDNDYVLIDYIEANIHLTKNTPINLMHGKINDKNIRIYDNNKLDLRGIKDIAYGDGVFDFVDINKLALYSEEFSRGVLEGYFDGNKPSRKFFRLLSLYEAYTILFNKVDTSCNKDHSLNEKEIKQILEMYDNFNTLFPKWAR
ncbi:MAG: kanamycin kinase [Anaerococcus sp.]|uniref:kanamycin kinase n=1 Tax=Anaerococcus sp. TaxID=1872515 RepID=UPI002620C762|nr:kanamycin kinase [Anaerococcus sp.]MCI5972941.1 kanamycin kinase [Anaerococcus sp.]MDD6919344.1 kanamycin kinase [Peptoniphilaceae bacterium]